MPGEERDVGLQNKRAHLGGSSREPGASISLPTPLSGGPQLTRHRLGAGRAGLWHPRSGEAAALPRRGKKRDPEPDEAGWQCEPAAGAGKAAFRRLAGRWVASAGPRGGAVVSSPAPVLCAPFSDPGRDWRAHLVVGGEKRSSTRDSLPERCSVEGTQPCRLLSLQGKHRARSPPSAFPPVSWQAEKKGWLSPMYLQN